MTDEKRGRGRPSKAKLKLEVAAALEKYEKKRQNQMIVGALRGKPLKTDATTIIQDKNLIKWSRSFKDLIDKNTDVYQIINKNPEIALIFEMYKNYANYSLLMEEMLNAAMRKGIETIIAKRKSKEKQDEISAKTQKIHNRIVEKYVEICANMGGFPGNGYRALIIKRINNEFGKNTLTDPTYVNKVLGDARKDGRLDPNIGKRRVMLQKNKSKK
jgi:hypothetical protein